MITAVILKCNPPPRQNIAPDFNVTANARQVILRVCRWCISATAVQRPKKRKERLETNQRRHHRHRLVRRHTRRNLRHASAGQKPASRRNATGTAGRSRRKRPARKPRPPITSEILGNDAIDAVMISATPEVLHYPMARDALLAGKHVFLEKPIAIELHEADELIAIARKNDLKFTIGYSQRFNPEIRLRQEMRYRRHARQTGERAGQPSHRPRPGQEDHRPHQAVAGGDGSDARSRFHPVVPGAGQAGARVFAGQLRRDAANQPALTFPTRNTSR